MSSSPSALKSAIPLALLPKGIGSIIGLLNVPLPLPRRMFSVSMPCPKFELTVTRSSFPSPFMSATWICAFQLSCRSKEVPTLKVPSPFPNNTENPQVMMSSLPSPLTSATTAL